MAQTEGTAYMMVTFSSRMARIVSLGMKPLTMTIVPPAVSVARTEHVQAKQWYIGSTQSTRSFGVMA